MRLEEYIKSKSGAAGRDPAAPLVFWDGYGLESDRSGVGVHARRLAAALRTETGEAPAVLGSEACARVWSEGPVFALPGPSVALVAKLASSKPVQPLRVERMLAAAVAAAAPQGKPVVLHGLSNVNLAVAPLRSHLLPTLRTVITVHDLIPLLAPDSVSQAYYWQFRMLLPQVLRRADRVICVSKWTRRTLLARWPEIARKTLVIPNGVESSDLKTNARQRRDLGPLTRILCVARHEPYKRLDRFIDIMRHGAERLRGRLVTDAAGKAWAEQAAADLVREGRLVVETGLGDEAYEAAFAQADVYVHTSAFEGFCLPAADALRAGKPVVYEAGSAMDEVVGEDAGIAVARGSATPVWLAATEAAARRGVEPGFLDVLRHHLRTMATWKDAAQAVASVYNGLKHS